jgi:hypothetical protein
MATIKYDSNIDITGDLALTGTVDGRDIATDGTKLDGAVGFISHGAIASVARPINYDSIFWRGSVLPENMEVNDFWIKIE